MGLLKVSLISGCPLYQTLVVCAAFFTPIAHDTYQLRHCCIASYLFYHLILSELRFYFVIDKILII